MVLPGSGFVELRQRLPGWPDADPHEADLEPSAGPQMQEGMGGWSEA